MNIMKTGQSLYKKTWKIYFNFKIACKIFVFQKKKLKISKKKIVCLKFRTKFKCGGG